MSNQYITGDSLPDGSGGGGGGAVDSVDGRVGVVTLTDLYEPKRASAGTAYNKDFGSGSGDVAEGDKAALLAGRTAGQFLISEQNIITVVGNMAPTLAQRGSIFRCESGALDITFGVPPDGVINFPLFSTFMLTRRTGNSGEVSVQRVGGVTFQTLFPTPNVDFKLDGHDGFFAGLIKVAADTWLAYGSIKAF